METKDRIYFQVRATLEERRAIKKAVKERTGLFFADWMRQAIACQLEADNLFFALDVSNSEQTETDAT